MEGELKARLHRMLTTKVGWLLNDIHHPFQLLFHAVLVSLWLALNRCFKNHCFIKENKRYCLGFRFTGVMYSNFNQAVRVWWCRWACTSPCMIQIKWNQAVQKEIEIKSPGRHVHLLIGGTIICKFLATQASLLKKAQNKT